VYSRNGKLDYMNPTKSKASHIFTMKDLQKILESPNKKNWNWSFMDTNIVPYYTPLDKNDTTLVFESRFECGNLNLAIKLTDAEYNLLLQNDSLTNGNTQWFYFKVSNTRKNKEITFNIINFVCFFLRVGKTRIIV